MTPSFIVRSTPQFERIVRRQLRGHPELRESLERAREIL